MALQHETTLTDGHNRIPSHFSRRSKPPIISAIFNNRRYRRAILQGLGNNYGCLFPFEIHFSVATICFHPLTHKPQNPLSILPPYGNIDERCWIFVVIVIMAEEIELKFGEFRVHNFPIENGGAGERIVVNAGEIVDSVSIGDSCIGGPGGSTVLEYVIPPDGVITIYNIRYGTYYNSYKAVTYLDIQVGERRIQCGGKARGQEVFNDADGKRFVLRRLGANNDFFSGIAVEEAPEFYLK